jgi:hypothetical protein
VPLGLDHHEVGARYAGAVNRIRHGSGSLLREFAAWLLTLDATPHIPRQYTPQLGEPCTSPVT